MNGIPIPSSKLPRCHDAIHYQPFAMDAAKECLRSRHARSDIVKLRSILNQVEMTQKEQSWIKQQSHDSKIVDGIAGERYVYNRR